MDFTFVSAIFQGVTALAIVVTAWQLLYHARQMHRDLEMEYVRQYWTIMSRASDEWLESFFESEPPTKSDYRVLLDYLHLCEDEIELRANGRVTDNTWAIWVAAISQMVQQPGVKKVIDELPVGKARGLRTLMAQLEPEKYDPLKKSKFWRRFHGL